jgi:hypothetical protein
MEVLNRHWEELKARKGYLNSAIGTKFKDGIDTGVKAIVVYVKHKQPCAELAESECIPTEIEGVPTDVVELNPNGWVASRTSISEMNPAEQKHRMGLNPVPPSLKAARPLETKTPSGASDWTKFASAIQDQKNCGCYDDKTEVLTKAGWKYWKDVTFEDDILCYEPESKILKYDKPLDLFVYDFEGDMVQIKGAAIDLLVTPNHNMLVYPWDESKRTISSKNKFTKADSLGWYFNIPCSGKWLGEEKEMYHLAGQPIGPYNVKIGREDYGFREGIDIPMDKWVNFLGIYIAEGYATPQSDYEVGIAAKTPEKRDRVEALVSSIPINHSAKPDRFRINNKILCQELRPLGQATDKYCPDYIKCLPSEQIRDFLNSFGLGDGQWTEDDTWRFWTSSKRLADDLQELIIKAGAWAQISYREGRDACIKGRKIHGSGEYSLYMSPRPHLCIMRDEHISRVAYKGKVYCAEVPTHAMVVRRNGKPLICGNSCPAFGSTGVWETKLRLVANNPALVCKLSEAHLFFCTPGASCETGSDYPAILAQAIKGVCLESCLPYKDVDQGCAAGICPDWWTTAYKLAGYNVISDPTAIKVALDAEPLAVSMAVYNSFFNYSSGVYKKQANDPLAGYHAIGNLGYSDFLIADLIRNSWGEKWGQGCMVNGINRPGYCWIGYGQLDPDRYQLLLDGQVPAPPNPPPVPPKKKCCLFGWLQREKLTNKQVNVIRTNLAKGIMETDF